MFVISPVLRLCCAIEVVGARVHYERMRSAKAALTSGLACSAPRRYRQEAEHSHVQLLASSSDRLQLLTGEVA